jgi:hypothetical protein
VAGATGEPSGGGSGTAGGGGLGGNGANGSAGGNVDARPTPTPEPMSGNSGAPGAGSGASSKSTPATTATHDPVATSKKASTTPDEVKSWFGTTFKTNDAVGGVANPITVHPDDEVTVFDGAMANDAVASATGNTSDGTGDGATLRSGLKGVADSKTTGGDTVDVSLHSDPVSLGSAVTDSGGAFSSTVRIPHSTDLGRHFIIALVPNTKNGKTAFVFPVSVEAREQAAAAADSTQPTSGSKRFPWVLVELLVGTASVIALFVVRVRRASAGHP